MKVQEPRRKPSGEAIAAANAKRLGKIVGSSSYRGFNPNPILWLVLAGVVGLALAFPQLFVVLGVAAVPTALVWFVNRRRQFLLFEHGFVTTYPSGAPAQVVAWNEIAETEQTGRSFIFNGFHVGTRVKLTLHLNGDRKVVLRSDIRNIYWVVQVVTDQVAALQLPAALQDLEAGRQLQFGPIPVTRDGIRHLHWTTMRAGLRPTVQNGYVKYLQVNAADVPNLALLMKIISHYVDGTKR